MRSGKKKEKNARDQLEPPPQIYNTGGVNIRVDRAGRRARRTEVKSEVERWSGGWGGGVGGFFRHKGSSSPEGENLFLGRTPRRRLSSKRRRKGTGLDALQSRVEAEISSSLDTGA